MLTYTHSGVLFSHENWHCVSYNIMDGIRGYIESLTSTSEFDILWLNLYSSDYTYSQNMCLDGTNGN